jgi:ribonuclease P protein component
MADVARQSAGATDAPAVFACPAPPLVPETLKKRADFLRAAKALRRPTGGFLLQARKRAPEEGVAGVRVGFTCSKKVGNAVTRNRAKRRLREVARAVLPEHGQAGWDYVLVGRPEASVAHDFAVMCEDLRRALRQIHERAT